MNIKKKLRSYLRGRDLREVSRDTGIAYHVLYYFTRRRDDVKLDVDVAEKLLAYFEG